MTLVIRTEQQQKMTDPGQPVVLPCANNATWVEFRLTSVEGEPVAGERYSVRLPDQSLHVGQLDADGVVRFDGIISGQATISFPDIDAREWGME